MLSILIIFFSLIISRTYSHVCKYEESVELLNRTYNGVYYEDGEYFVDNTTDLERGCVCFKQKCIQKCCPFGQLFNRNKRRCEDAVDEFSPAVWEGSEIKHGYDFKKNFHVFISNLTLKCAKNETRLFLGDIVDYFHLNLDGYLHAKEVNAMEGLVYGHDKYCMDNFVDSNSFPVVKPGVLACYEQDYNEAHIVVKASCMVISCFFIILTIAVYGFLPELRTTIHGKVMLAYLSSFLFGLLLLASILYAITLGYISRFSCIIMTFITYFSLLAAHFWLNVMSFDIYRKFNKINNSRDSRSRFYWYCVYGFGMPTVLTVILAGMEFSGLPKDNIFIPNIRKGHCFMNGTTRRVYYFIPMSVICAANLIFFLLVARRLVLVSKDTRRLQKKHTQQYGLYVKLFIVAGVSWILDVISDFCPNLDNFWIVTDSYNILVGLIVFIIFVCKKKVLILLRDRFKLLWGTQVKKPEITPQSSSTSVAHSLENVVMTCVAPVVDNRYFESTATKL